MSSEDFDSDIRGRTVGRSEQVRNCIIAGGGPCGLLTAINLLKDGWNVTLLEKGDELTEATRAKSWMISIASIGQQALSEIDGLWDQVKVAVQESKQINMHFGKMKFEIKSESALVDRNNLVIKLLDFLKAMPEAAERLTLRFNCKVAFVDGREKSVWIKVRDEPLQPLTYDLLVGADGTYSMVRNSLFSQSPQYHFSQSDILQSIKTIFIKCPKGINPSAMTFFPNVVKGCNALMLPSDGEYLNFILGSSDENILDERFVTSDPLQLQKLLNNASAKLNLSLEDCENLLKATWYQTQQLTCYPYHLGQKYGSAVLVGDAAHATSPGMGMGLNTALVDASVLSHCLSNNNGEDIDAALEAYSAKRIKVGHALTYLSFNMTPLSASRMAWTQTKNSLRRLAKQLTGGWVDGPVAEEVAQQGWYMDEAFTRAMKQGGVKENAESNQRIMQKHMWRKIGLIPHSKKSLKAAEQRSLLLSQDIHDLSGKTKK
ncbi:hypothetical protein MP228_004168 [Amoeboaphelidium protococcarum]|nr:hypothetical protein MP228_004168 [Amoeboaphelidium protococcarum]